MAGARPAGDAAAPPQPRGEAPALERALSTAALRVGDAMSGLGLGTGARTARRLSAAEAFAGFDAQVLCLLLDPPGLDAAAVRAHSPETMAALTGLIVLDPGLVDALVEVQTIGRVDGPARPPRRPTRIDAALAQPFARAILEQLGRLLPPDTGEPCPGGLRPGSFVAGPDTLALILTAPHYLRVDLTIDLGNGARQASLSLVLPVDGGAVPEAGKTLDPEAEWKCGMRAAAMDSPVLLQAMLPSMRIPLSRLLGMKVGDLIPLDPQALTRITLHGGASGLTMAGRKRLPRGAALTARLGQLNGTRAVKIAALPGETAEAGVEDGFGAGRPGGAEAALPGGAERVPAKRDLPDLPALDDLADPAKLADLPEHA